MAYCLKTNSEKYIIWDADTIPLSPYDYEKSEHQLVFMVKREYHKPYFDTINKLFGGEIGRYDPDVSFISENMVIDCKIMKEMISQIESKKENAGESFYEKILYAVNKEDLAYSGFSEFETYGNYVMYKHRSRYVLERKMALRSGAFLLGSCPGKEQLEWISKDYDVVSIENKADSWKGHILETWFSVFFRMRFMRRIIPAKKAVFWADKVRRIQCKLIGVEYVPYNDF